MNEVERVSSLQEPPEYGTFISAQWAETGMAENEYLPAINRMVADIEQKEAEIAGLKRTVNTLCAYANMPVRYPNADDSSVSSGSVKINPGQFHRKPLATAVGEYLKMRGDPRSGGIGPATVDEIYSSLVQGGFKFDAKSDATAKRSLAISLAKNTATFERLGSGHIGLRTWYQHPRED